MLYHGVHLAHGSAEPKCFAPLFGSNVFAFSFQCGRPMERAQCVDCGAPIGGERHIALPNFAAMPYVGFFLQPLTILDGIIFYLWQYKKS